MIIRENALFSRILALREIDPWGFSACFILTRMQPRKLLRRSPIPRFLPASTLNCGVLKSGLLGKKDAPLVI